MQRTSIFVLFVIAIPMGSFWAGTGRPPPGRAIADFVDQVRALRGPPRAAPATAEISREAQEPKTRPPAPDPALPPPPDPAPPPAASPEPRETAEELFLSGRFAESADAFARLDPEREAESRFALALQRAFPERIPHLPYVTVTTASGFAYDGFAEERGGSLVLERPASATISLPLTSVVTQVARSRDEFLVRARLEAAEVAGAADVEGKHLFFLLQRAMAVGDGRGAARLVRRALDMDEKEAFLLSSFQSRIDDVRLREEVFRAYSACRRPPEPAAAPPAPSAPAAAPERQPKKPEKSIVKDAAAEVLMGRAKPLYKRADEIYKRVATNALLDKSAPGDVAEINEALQLYREADKLYAEVIEIEPDNSFVAAIVRHVSKHAAQLEMLKTQLAAGAR